MSRVAGLDGHAAEADDSQERYFRWLFSRLGIPANGRCLDIGCADPRVLGAFARTGRTPVGFSFDGLNSLTVRRLYPDAEVADLDYDEAGEVYARAGDTFDFMFCRGLGFAERLLDWQEPGFVDATRALSQCLTPSGVLLWAQYPDRRLGLAEPIIQRRAVQGLLRHLDLAGLRLLSFAPTSTVVTVLAVRPDYPLERETSLHQANARDWLSILRHVRATLEQVPIEEENATPVDDTTVLDALQAASAHLSTLYLPRVTEQRLLIVGSDAVAQIYARAAEDLGQRVVGFWSSIASEWNGSGMRHPIGWLPAAPDDRPTAIVVADPRLEPAVTVALAGMTPVLPVLNLWPRAPYVSDFLQSGWRGRPGFVDTLASRHELAGTELAFIEKLRAARNVPSIQQSQTTVSLGIAEPVENAGKWTVEDSIEQVESVSEMADEAIADPDIKQDSEDLSVIAHRPENTTYSTAQDFTEPTDFRTPSPSNESVPTIEFVELTVKSSETSSDGARLSEAHADPGDVESLILGSTLRHVVEHGSGSISRQDKALRMVVQSQQEARLVYGPSNDWPDGQIGFSARIKRQAGDDAICRIAMTAGDRQAYLVLDPQSVWITDRIDDEPGADNEQSSKPRPKALVWTITASTVSAGSRGTVPARQTVAVDTSVWHQYGILIHRAGVELWLDNTVVQRLAFPIEGGDIVTTVPVTVEFGLWSGPEGEVWWRDPHIATELAPLTIPMVKG